MKCLFNKKEIRLSKSLPCSLSASHTERITQKMPMDLNTDVSTEQVALVKPVKKDVNRGAWTAEEDRKLTEAIKVHGAKRWTTIAAKAGLKRSGKSCRLRWMNYLRPNIKRGNISDQEEDLILRLHKLLGNRWSLIAGRLPGRTDNEIKNYWNSHLSKKVIQKKKQHALASSKEGSKNQRRKVVDELNEEKREENTSSGVHDKSTVSFDVDGFLNFPNQDPFSLEWVSKFLELTDD